MQTKKVIIGGEKYTLTALRTGESKSLQRELSESANEDESLDVIQKYLVKSLRIEHPEIGDDFIYEKSYLYEIHDLSEALIKISSLKSEGDDEGKR